jgi:hypothetical protein
MRTVDERRARGPNRQQQQMADGKVERPKQDKQQQSEDNVLTKRKPSHNQWANGGGDWKKAKEVKAGWPFVKYVKACWPFYNRVLTLAVSGLDCW